MWKGWACAKSSNAPCTPIKNRSWKSSGGDQYKGLLSEHKANRLTVIQRVVTDQNPLVEGQEASLYSPVQPPKRELYLRIKPRQRLVQDKPEPLALP